jgi:predicted enzyme related to lactoylglutathione lyase
VDFRIRGRDVAGIHEHTEDQGTGWSSNISVDDLDRATSRARELGASVLAEPFDVPGAGRTSVLQDPSGAVVSLWQAGGHGGAGLVNEIGTWTWNELVAQDLEAAKGFYGQLFGWAANDLPGPITRTSFMLGELLVGGGHVPVPQEDPNPRWTISFRVADADRSAEQARELGGRILLPPMDVPMGRFGIARRPVRGGVHRRGRARQRRQRRRRRVLGPALALLRLIGQPTDSDIDWAFRITCVNP